MKLILSILVSLICLLAQAQSTSQPITTDANTSITPNKLQSGNLKQLVLQSPNDANAWLNYYNSFERDKSVGISEKRSQQKNTLISAREYITGTWQYSLMTFLQSNKRDSSALFNALELAKDKSVVYPYIAQFAIIKNDQSLLKKYCTAINSSTPLTKSMYEYHYNTLMSAGQGGAIYAKGLSDLVPLAILQQVYGIRKDIVLKYYENKIGNENAYLCLSLGKEILEQYPDGVYTGLLVRLSKEENKGMKPADNFSLTFLDAATSLNGEEKLVYRNYLPSMLLLYKDQLVKSDPAAENNKKRINHLAVLTGTTPMVNNLLSR